MSYTEDFRMKKSFDEIRECVSNMFYWPYYSNNIITKRKQICAIMLNRLVFINCLSSSLCFRRKSGYVSTARPSGWCPEVVSMILHFLFRIHLPSTSQWARPVTRHRPVSKALSTNPLDSRVPGQSSPRRRNHTRELEVADHTHPLLPNSQPTPRPRHQLRHQYQPQRPRNSQNPQRRSSRPSMRLRTKLPKRPNPPRRKESRSRQSRTSRSPGTMT